MGMIIKFLHVTFNQVQADWVKDKTAHQFSNVIRSFIQREDLNIKVQNIKDHLWKETEMEKIIH